jgi:hypothetical protein
MSRISQNLQSGLLLVFVVLLPAAPDAAADDALGASMKHLEFALAQAEQALANIDISKLSVQYREGKLIENTRTRALRYVTLARDSMNQLKKNGKHSRRFTPRYGTAWSRFTGRSSNCITCQHRNCATRIIPIQGTRVGLGNEQCR